jgi:hypothetical protein
MVLLVLLELTSGFCFELHLKSETGSTSDRTEKAQPKSARPTTDGIQSIPIYGERMMRCKSLKNIECLLNGMSYTIHTSLVSSECF